ncbi:MAG: hypothetical protein GF411_02350 [Candidatus Lokiarchaeota archaeon]|nr:hypothetical protein [Candidatus Lokiarchaeota archaeon]
MAITRRILLISVLFMCLTFVMPANVAACDATYNSDFGVAIDHANYSDIDGDSVADDVLTITRIFHNSEFTTIKKTIVFTTVQVPSGRIFHSILHVKGDYSTMEVTIEWYNIAKEAGWYDLNVFALLITSDGVIFLHAYVSFDPPEGGDPGPPLYPDAEINETVNLM